MYSPYKRCLIQILVISGARAAVHPSLADKEPREPRGHDLHDMLNSSESGVLRGVGSYSSPAPDPTPPTSSTAATINFNNPSVQKALDDLMQRGPNLLMNLPGGSSSGRGGSAGFGIGDDYGPPMTGFRGAGPQLY